MRVLDTAALLHLPLSDLDGIAAESQRGELERLSPERAFALVAAPLEWNTPAPDSLARAHELAAGTGDLAGLSPVDLDVLALALQLDAVMVTDDYRLQNCCAVAGLAHETVLTEGIREEWRWSLQCTGCGALKDADSQSTTKGDHGNCNVCGSAYRLRKR